MNQKEGMFMKTDYLNEIISTQLYSYQINKIDMEIIDFIEVNHAADEYVIDCCPKCGKIHPPVIKGGITSKGKQMLRCKTCNKRFVVDFGQLTFYSHQEQSKWNDLIIDTKLGCSLKETAAKLNVNEMTVFRMRHKYLRFLEEIENSYILKEQIELDEKYFPRNHKGSKLEDLKSKHRGTPASKRGLSNEQVCLLTGVERFGKAIAHAFNMAKPKSEDILNIEKSIQDKSNVWTDGLTSYEKMIERKHCILKVVKSKKEYDAINHLNNVNSFHSKIEAAYSKYKGVASKYINRYAALFEIQREYADMDKQEYLLLVLKRLKRIHITFFIRQINQEDIFSMAF